jgi:hypothetical protein
MLGIGKLEGKGFGASWTNFPGHVEITVAVFGLAVRGGIPIICRKQLLREHPNIARGHIL